MNEVVADEADEEEVVVVVVAFADEFRFAACASWPADGLACCAAVAGNECR